MIEFNQGLLYAFIFGVLFGIVWGARKIVMLERIILTVDYNIKRILERVEKEEKKIEKKLKIK